MAYISLFIAYLHKHSYDVSHKIKNKRFKNKRMSFGQEMMGYNTKCIFLRKYTIFSQLDTIPGYDTPFLKKIACSK